jgi:O-antigen biosynthesis protein
VAVPANLQTPIVQVVIDCAVGTDGLEATLRSLDGAGLASHPIIIGPAADASNSAIAGPNELATAAPCESWLLVVQPGDELAPEAGTVYGTAAAQAAEDTVVIYADDDLIDHKGRRYNPHFKPDWNPELYDHHDFLTGSCILRVDRSAFASLPPVGWAQALVRTAIDRGASPLHVQRVLHHRRFRPAPIVPAKPASSYAEPDVSISVIIPTRNQDELLRTCLRGLRQTNYRGLETIIVDNGSDEPQALEYLARLCAEDVTVLRRPGPFNYSALNNSAARTARGDLLCLLNNDIEITDPDWLSLLVTHAIKPDVGAVGARLLYPDGTIQHAGVFTGIGGGAAHAHRYQQAEDPGYFERARLPQRVSAVTAACMVVARDKFLAVGGFDEINFPVAFNDVDLCLKLNRRGWQSFYEPRSKLIHHESKSRGSDRAKANKDRFAGELAALKRIWSTDKVPDPYHHPDLSPFCEQFLVGV